MSKIKEKSNKHGKTLIQWKFMEFEEYDRSILWYLFMGTTVIALLIYCFFTANPLFAIILLLIAFITFLHHRHKATELDFKITEDGLEIGTDFYSYKELKKFWIIYEPPEVKNLYFQTSRIIHSHLSIPLNSTNPVKVRKILLDYLTEDLEQENESSTDRWARLFRL